MNSIGVAMFFLLTAIAVVHLTWAFGSRWPARSERALVALAVGRTGQTRMPTPLQCVAAATAVFVAGLWALALTDFAILSFKPIVVTIIAIIITAILALRGIAAYTTAWRVRFSQEPFATFDRTKYGPLCLLLAVGFAALVIRRLGY
ncbi:MAG: DUF3995 domain-containing protein [Xanthobacteraceae bacterium]